MYNVVTADLLIIFTLFIGSVNLITPFISKEDSFWRSFAMLTVSILFWLNIVLLGYLTLHGINGHYELISFKQFSIALHVEPLGIVFASLVATLWFPALLYTIKFLAINNMRASNRFLFFMNGCVLIGIFIAFAANLFTMFVGYELLTLCTIPLIAHSPNQRSAQGLYKYLKVLLLSSLLLFLPAILIIYHYCGHGSFVNGGFVEGNITGAFSQILVVMLVLGIAKAALFPFHIWLPAAMVASYPVSALLHAVVVVKTGLFCIYKIFIYVFGLHYLQSIFVTNWLLIIPIVTILYSSLQAIRHTQVKMMLAFSTINQLSIALLSAFLLTPKGMIAAIMHMVSHSFTKICIFYASGNMYSAKSTYHIHELIGIKATLPKSSLILLIAGLSLMGIPPLAGFISKFYILLAAAEQNNLLVMLIIAFSTLFSAFYMIRMLIFIYRPIDDKFILQLKLKTYFDEEEAVGKNRIISAKQQAEYKLPKMMLASIFLCLIGVVGFFLVQQVIIKFLALL